MARPGLPSERASFWSGGDCRSIIGIHRFKSAQHAEQALRSAVHVIDRGRFESIAPSERGLIRLGFFVFQIEFVVESFALALALRFVFGLASMADSDVLLAMARRLAGVLVLSTGRN